MRQSQLFTKTRKDAPKDEISKNAELLIRAGFVHKEMAGVYSFLPLGLRTLTKIVQVIREEMNAIGGQELIMTALQNKEIWEKTGRWDDAKVDNWFKTTLKSGGEAGLGITHEEPLTQMMTEHISSYRDLPVYPYQIQTKFRNEMRAKSGIMRCKEFLMKDLYSFSRDKEEHQMFYEKAREAYRKIFARMGIGDRTYVTYASGGIFSEFSEEFQTLSDTGEDTIYVDKGSGVAINKEVMSDVALEKLNLKRENLSEHKSIEVGNIFHLGTKFSAPLGLMFADERGERHSVIMGSYGLGPTRLMGTLVEALSDERGIIWPEAVAPFRVHLIELPGKDEVEQANVKKAARDCYEKLLAKGVEVLYDDRTEKTAGEKFADGDLIGVPWRVVISEKTIAQDTIEVKKRKEHDAEMMTIETLINKIATR